MSLLPFEIAYTGLGGEVRLDASGLVISNANLLNYSWRVDASRLVDGSGMHVNRFYLEAAEKRLDMSIWADSAEDCRRQVDDLIELVERDVISKSPGKLTVNGEFLTCYIIGVEVGAVYQRAAKLSLVVYAPRPVWQRIIELSFWPGAGEITTGHKFPFKFPFGYINDGTSNVVANDHYAAAFALIKIFGYVKDPVFTVAGHQYAYFDTLEAGERVEIDQRSKTLTKVYQNGQTENVFNKRGKVQSVFEPFPPGNHMLYASGTFGIDITLFPERSTPTWQTS